MLQKYQLAACLLLASLGFAGLGGCYGDSLTGLDSRLRDQMGQVKFDPAGQPGEPFLVVLIDVTKNDAVARDTGLELILGQPKSSSTTADLLIVSTANGSLVAQYYASDPRFSKMENRAWTEADSATMRIFIPLSVNIDLVSIKPVPGREPVVSGGGQFDPRPLMKLACEQVPDAELEAHYSECYAAFSLMVP